MASRRGNPNKANRAVPTPEERHQTERDVQLAVYRLQDSAYANLRNGIAIAAIVLGLFIGVDAITGSVNGARWWPTAVCLLAAVLGAGYFLTRSRPRLSLYLLIAAAVTILIGVGSLIVVVYVVQQ